MAETVHRCPPEGAAAMPCCGRTPFEARNDRMTVDPALVTCTGVADPTLTDEELAMLVLSADTCSYCKPEILSLVAALRSCREDLRIADEAALALLATAAEATRELERLREGWPDMTITRERTIVSREPVILWLWRTHRWAYHAFFGVLFALILFLAAT